MRAAVEDLASRGLEVDLRIIGFALDDLAIRSFEGLGTFENAGSVEESAADAFAASCLVVAGLTVAPEVDNAFAFDLEPATEVTVEVEPIDPVAGPAVTARFDGAPPGERRGWLAVAPADAGDEVYLDWSYTSSAAGTVDLRVPDEPGALEVRYHLVLPEGASRVIGRSPAFTSRAATASLDGPKEVGAGSQFAVEWTGPDNDRDYLTIVPEGAREGSYDSYQYTRNGSPATLTAPDQPGAYEVRYVTGVGDRTLASVPITVR